MQTHTATRPLSHRLAAAGLLVVIVAAAIAGMLLLEFPPHVAVAGGVIVACLVKLDDMRTRRARA